MKLLLSILTAGAVSAHGHTKETEKCSPLPALAKACKQDYDTYCRQVDDLDLVSMLACGKSHEDALQPQCSEEIHKSFPALYACSPDIHAACPGFGRLVKGQWEYGNDDDDDDDDDDDSWGRRRFPNPEIDDWNFPPPPPPMEESSEEPSVERRIDETEPEFGAFHSSKKPTGDSNAQCFKNALPNFSTLCHSAIADQWLAQQQKKGITMPASPSPDEIYEMMSPPAYVPSSRMMSAKMQHVATAIVVAVFTCLLLTCLCCCCCRRCKKRRTARRVAAMEREVPLTPLPEAVAVPVSGATGYVPMAAPVPAVPQAAPATPQVNRAPAYLPYTGQGLNAFMPVAQPVHV